MVSLRALNIYPDENFQQPNFERHQYIYEHIEVSDRMDEVDKTLSHEKRNVATIHVAHLRAISDVCLQVGIPAPMAAMHSRKASSLLKSLSIEDTDKTPRCYRCALNFTQKGAFVLQIAKTKRPSAKLLRRLRRRNDKRALILALKSLERSKFVSVIAICSGCGSEMKCGRMRQLLNERMNDAVDETLCSLHSTTTSMNQTRIASVSATPQLSLSSITRSNRSVISSKSVASASTRRHRKAASRLQAIIIADDANTTPKRSSLSAFLESLKA